MPLFKKIAENDVLIGIWKMTETIETLESLSTKATLNDSRFQKFNSDSRKREFLSVRLLLQELISDKVKIKYTDSGKPYLNNSMFNISISHNKDYAVVILSVYNVGIDIESTKRNTQKIRKRYLSNQELRNIKLMTDENYGSVLFWAAKEAIYKSVGQRGIIFNKHIKVICTLNELYNFNLGINSFYGFYSNDFHEEYFKLYVHDINDAILVYAIENEYQPIF